MFYINGMENLTLGELFHQYQRVTKHLDKQDEFNKPSTNLADKPVTKEEFKNKPFSPEIEKMVMEFAGKVTDELNRKLMFESVTNEIKTEWIAKPRAVNDCIMINFHQIPVEEKNRHAA